jgi:hypothetical protein
MGRWVSTSEKTCDSCLETQSMSLQNQCKQRNQDQEQSTATSGMVATYEGAEHPPSAAASFKSAAAAPRFTPPSPPAPKGVDAPWPKLSKDVPAQGKECFSTSSFGSSGYAKCGVDSRARAPPLCPGGMGSLVHPLPSREWNLPFAIPFHQLYADRQPQQPSGATLYALHIHRSSHSYLYSSLQDSPHCVT